MARSTSLGFAISGATTAGRDMTFDWERPRRHSAMLQQKILAAAFAFIVSAPIDANCAPANSLSDLRRALKICVISPPTDADGSEVTIVFAIKRDGSLLGTPRITHWHLPGSIDTQRSFIATAIKAFSQCMPLSVTDSLGGAIAGRLLSIRIGDRHKGTRSRQSI